MKFELEIFLGNKAMSDAPAIADALRTVADTLDAYYVGCDPIEATSPSGMRTKIFDYSGNKVGRWAVTEH
jgi:hypothetical protein